MRTGKFDFYGKTYLLTFSARTNASLEAEGIRLDRLNSSDTPVSSMVRVLYYMIDAGSRYAKLAGIDNPGTVDYDTLLDGLDTPDLQQLPGLIAEVMEGERNVEATPPKNAGAPR